MDDIASQTATGTDGSGSSAVIDGGLDPSGAVVIRLSGEVDISNIEAVRGLIEPVANAGADHVVFDLRGLRFIDSTGLSLLLWVAQRVAVVQLRHPSPIVQRVIDVTGLGDVLPTEP
jgi:anti-sigma B factor antagonist